eukprot:1154236-Pelagomonas_calceolata.AAC.11
MAMWCNLSDGTFKQHGWCVSCTARAGLEQQKPTQTYNLPRRTILISLIGQHMAHSIGNQQKPNETRVIGATGDLSNGACSHTRWPGGREVHQRSAWLPGGDTVTTGLRTLQRRALSRLEDYQLAEFALPEH